ncbi:hypothetical protein LIER_10315 [Lithospermum erythrorhizon]|uniref:Uncharacterized protein n=1 Tax=Lithospermum erythrorhizon TaxID=34254 RepID=A0AAV3PIW3_LITER
MSSMVSSAFTLPTTKSDNLSSFSEKQYILQSFPPRKPQNLTQEHQKMIVYVVLEAQYQSSLSAAIQYLNKTANFAKYGVVGYLVEELRDEKS